MNSHFTYLMATERNAELRRAAELARLAKAERDVDSTNREHRLTSRTIVRPRFRTAAARRLHLRRV